jgi:hypothetical protein
MREYDELAASLVTADGTGLFNLYLPISFDNHFVQNQIAHWEAFELLALSHVTRCLQYDPHAITLSHGQVGATCYSYQVVDASLKSYHVNASSNSCADCHARITYPTPKHMLQNATCTQGRTFEPLPWLCKFVLLPN